MKNKLSPGGKGLLPRLYSDNREDLKGVVFSILAILLSFVLVGIILLAMGYRPLRAFSALFSGAFGSTYAISLTLSRAVPLIFVGLSVGFAMRGGFFNIGGEGQLYIGGFTSAVVALALPAALPVPVTLVLALGSGILAGMFWGGSIGLIRAKLNINEVVVAIMLNYIAQLFTSFMVNTVFLAEGSMTGQTDILPESLVLSKIVPNTQLTTSLYIALAVSVAYALFFSRTVAGFEVSALGENPTAARSGGINIMRSTFFVMACSGALSAMAGIFEVFGTYGRFIDGFSTGLGFTGIAVAFIGRQKAAGIVLASLLFGALQAGSMRMSMVEGISANIIQVVQGFVIIFIATPNILIYLSRKKAGK